MVGTGLAISYHIKQQLVKPFQKLAVCIVLIHSCANAVQRFYMNLISLVFWLVFGGPDMSHWKLLVSTVETIIDAFIL